LAVDPDDGLYPTTITGVQVFDVKRTIRHDSRAAPPFQRGLLRARKSTLYITAGKRLYSIEMLAQGPDRLGK